MRTSLGVSHTPVKFALAVQCVLLAAFWLIQGPGASQSNRDGLATGSLTARSPTSGAPHAGDVPSDLAKERITSSNLEGLDQNDLVMPSPERAEPDGPAPLLLAGLHTSAVSLTAPTVSSRLATSQSTGVAVPSRLVAYSLAKGDGGMFDRANRRRSSRNVGSGSGRSPGPIGGGIGGRGIGGRGGSGGSGGGNCPGSGR